MSLSPTQLHRLTGLYRNIQRQSLQFLTPNFREYFYRCARQDFRQFLSLPTTIDANKSKSGPDSIEGSNAVSNGPDARFEQFCADMENHLNLLKRQSVINSLYSEPSVSVTR